MTVSRLRRCLPMLIPMLPLLLGAGGKGGDPVQALGLTIAGPLVLLLWIASTAVVYLILSSLRRQDRIVTLAQSAVVEVGRGKILFTLWGILAEIMLFAAGLVLVRFPGLRLVGVLVWLLALALAGLGAMVSAYVAGRRLHAELNGGEIAPLSALGLGLRVFFIASALPFVGWIVVILLTVYGAGAVLTASARGGEQIAADWTVDPPAPHD